MVSCCCMVVLVDLDDDVLGVFCRCPRFFDIVLNVAIPLVAGVGPWWS